MDNPEKRLLILGEWINSTYPTFTTVMSTSYQGDLFLCAFQSPNHTSHDFRMAYLPVFYLIVECESGDAVRMKVMTFHGRTVRELVATNDESKKEFVDAFKSLRLCKGIKNPEDDLKFNSETFSRIYLVENLDSEHIVLRSQGCLFGLDSGDVCENCETLDSAQGKAKESFVEEDEDLKPDLSDIPDHYDDEEPLASLKRKRKPQKSPKKRLKSSNVEIHEPNVEIKGEPLEDFSDLEDKKEVKPGVSQKLNSPRKVKKKMDLKIEDLEKKEIVKKHCTICCVSFDDDDFVEDQKKHETSRLVGETVKCPSCSVTVLKVNLNLHFDNDHPELRAACCFECLKIYTPKQKVSVHFHRCHRDTTSKLCPICGVSASNLKAHMNKIHKTEKPNKLMCAICGNEFVSKVILNRHIQFVHEQEKNSKCKFCGQKFKTEAHLRMHYWSLHLKVKPYKCKHCSYVAKQPNRIYEHCRDVHKLKGTRADVIEIAHEFERIKEFETQHGIYRKKVRVDKESQKHCWLCNKYFEKRDRLEIHELAHLDLKPYVCHVKNCSCSFICKRHLKDHVKAAHGESEIPEDCTNEDLLDLYQRLRKIPGSVLKIFGKSKSVENLDSNTRIFYCSLCTKGSGSFETTGHFYQHMSRVHEEEISEKNPEFVGKIALGEKLVCKICDLETMSSKVLEQHVIEVHKFDWASYQAYIPPPMVQPEPKIFRPRQFRCKHCIVYTAVKKFTVHRHIKKTHGILDSTDNDLLLISDVEKMDRR